MPFFFFILLFGTVSFSTLLTRLKDQTTSINLAKYQVVFHHQEQRRCVDGTLQREVKKVRKARNRRQEWNMMALDKELRPDHRHTIHRDRGASSEGSMSPENR